MSVYDVDKLMLEARRLAAEYRRATGKPLGISNEIAVHDVIRIMGLEAAGADTSGYDAVGTRERKGQRIQIKGRSIASEAKSSQRIGQIKMDQEWDSVMLILMGEDYAPIEIYEASRDAIIDAVKKSSTKRRNRGALSVAKFKYIGKRVWAETETGIGSDEALPGD